MAESTKPRIVIIGGGIAGLTAGIYAQKNGFDSTIYEQHLIVGGECTVWKRQGFVIDNCVHWLTGTNPSSEMYKVWCDVGVLGSDIEVRQSPSFFHVEEDGKEIDLWYDKVRMHSDLLRLSPEDADRINEFMEVVEIYHTFVLPAIKPWEQMSLWEKITFLKKMKALGKLQHKYARMSIEDYASLFHHPLIKKFLLAYMPKYYNVASMFYVFATYLNGNGGLPQGGSIAMIDRMVQKYKDLGGKIFTHHKAVKIHHVKRQAVSVEFENGMVVETDYIVCACDPHVVFTRLVEPKLFDKYFLKHYQDNHKYPLYSSFNCYLSVDHITTTLRETSIIDVPEYTVGCQRTTKMLVKNFNYEPGFSPDGKTILQILVMQYEEDYDYWEALYTNGVAQYKSTKRAVSEVLQQRLEDYYPELKGHTIILDSVTPYTYHRFCGAYKGAYMSFILTPFAKKRSHNGRVIGLKNVFLAGQWLQSPGGLPNAAVTGRFAIQRICKRGHLPFNLD